MEQKDSHNTSQNLGDEGFVVFVVVLHLCFSLEQYDDLHVECLTLSFLIVKYLLVMKFLCVNAQCT